MELILIQELPGKLVMGIQKRKRLSGIWKTLEFSIQTNS